MACRNTYNSYGSVSKFFHWILFLLVVFMIVLGFFMGDASKPLKLTLYTIHKSTGMTILILMVMRILWRWSNPIPDLPPSVPLWQQLSARLTHGFLYLLLFIMPLSGWMLSTAASKPVNFWWLGTINFPWLPKSKALAEVFESIHEICVWILIVFITLHILAALKHYCFDKQKSIVRRMLPFTRG